MTTPTPPGWKAKIAGHHWLDKRDSDGHSFGLVVLQWNPVAKKWSHSGDCGTGIYIETRYWQYVSECPMPEEQAP